MRERAARLDAQEAALDALLAALDERVGDDAAEPDARVAALDARAPGYAQYHRIGHKRQAAYRRLAGDRAAARAHYAPVLAALLADDDLSSPCWLAQVLVVAGGRRRLQEELVAAVEGGEPLRQACAVGAWRWADAPYPDLAERFRAARVAAAERAADPWVHERLGDSRSGSNG
ncbi:MULTISPECIES: hypothetical protein [Kitasatospora]|uniref:Uncharacterized protein n=1 Tax=Kitasatospora setae (strain ATCC 33774 / DSM 43861 / JCM 3304 / KCC A-0304 / NBRC 14216 / KM-6054) TaxID=452652 RepID=E4N9D8_KITSK|nr:MULTISPECIES: hypothetical protein [Kitasatospora]BAJ27819.1 hypothetical protein KSE_19960 [Kitasatospora setae KM-6054]